MDEVDEEPEQGTEEEVNASYHIMPSISLYQHILLLPFDIHL